ncbi:pituitary tumor-transforming gene 1 protein-interacting protein [Parasteatoda tepidariorum]|uniref:pituitary tumor-transforming gene 1 protein-interacting protein n=1 Tax=Parasteatoda tepidariorum TaxID=114398 RepID=UPI001C723D0E|nr:pituitary tumor-transforming gene 1 protein-interacting protein [Parasteatoda tepidariorum]
MNKYPQIFSLICNICLLASFAYGETTEPEVNATSVTEEPFPSTTTIASNITCENHNNDCKACVAYSECFYCGTDNICRRKITDAITGDECSLKEIHYLTCRVNFQYMLIGIGILILVAFLIITIFCCICCCRRKGLKISKADLKWARQREERKQIQMERRQERAERTEEIRKKYGLVKGSNPYQKFDA